MQEIIAPVDRALLKAELTEERKFRDTNKGGNELYIVDAHNAPNTIREIGRLREEAFRAAGSSSGLSMDIDRFDTMDVPYRQIIVWDPEAEAVIGGYRFIFGENVSLTEDGQPDLASAHMFHFSDEFIRDYLPSTVELGRSFVALDYQSSKAGAKALFALDNLWDGIAALPLAFPQVKYFFGKMTVHRTYDPAARDLIYHFLEKHFPDADGLVRPYRAVPIATDSRLLEQIIPYPDFKEDYRALKAAVMKMGTQIPPLVNSYMSVSPTMRTFGSAVNTEMGDALETGILVCFNDLYDEKRRRHVASYLAWLDRIRARLGK